MARRPGEPFPLTAMRVTARAVSSAQKGSTRVRTVIGRVGFPYRAPTVPRTVDVPPTPKRTGADFDTDWARRPLAQATRRVLLAGPLQLAVKAIADPEIVGTDRLADLRAEADDTDDAPPCIFVANHHSHLDTPLMLAAIPTPWRHRMVVGAAADYFFGTRITGTASALVLNAFPIDRTSVNRRSADLAAELIRDGWSLVIFPEGGRSPDGWGQPFKGGAAFLAERTGAPIVPVHIDGTGAILGKGMNRPKRGRTKVTFGTPLRLGDGENIRRFGTRIEHAVEVLADEAISDYWAARRRAAQGATPSLTGPDYRGWRRAWALTEHRAKGKAGQRRRQKRRWPKLN
jgi:1-acyl-sn-glycerol-3-phosphate acyltransferase